MSNTPSYIFGANILENLTTGMYKDSKVIYREYIQNACDQIDKAVRSGLLKKGEGVINIWLDIDRRTVTIEDNATGIPSAEFQRTLGNIADSDKRIGEDKGFRGIGRLSGLAYCNELSFHSSANGESVESVMVCDAKKMRHLIQDNQLGNRMTANEVLHKINRFEMGRKADVDNHYFRVEMVDINRENIELLDFKSVKEYLSFVAPVPYQNSFIYRSDVYDHARELAFDIDEYTVKLNGEQVFKKYTTILIEPSGAKYDEIFGVEFKDFLDADGSLLAWMWVGLSRFQKAIPKANQMRGMRLRKENIQIGGEDALQKLFKEDRGNSYYVGEVFAVDSNLIPNSQRDYFNENPTRAEFEHKLSNYFIKELHRLYYDGSAINSAYKKIEIYGNKKRDFEANEDENKFIDTEHRECDQLALTESQKVAEAAFQKIEKMKASAYGPMQKVIKQIEGNRPVADLINFVAKPQTVSKKNVCTVRRTDKLLKTYSKSVVELISKIYKSIRAEVDDVTADRIISRIEKDIL